MSNRQLVVIGAGLGGLSAAIYGRLEGWDVEVLEKGNQCGGKAAGLSVGGFQLDPGPSIIILPQIYQQVFKDAGRSLSDYLEFERLETISRVFFRGEDPLDLPGAEQDCLALLRDLSHRDAQNLEELLDRLGQVEPLLEKTVYAHPFSKPSQLLDPRLLRFGMTFNPMKSYRELVDSMFELPLLRAFFYGFPSYGGQSWTAKSPAGFMIAYYMIRDGVYFPKGGVRAIPAAFETLAKELGVSFRANTEVTGVVGAGRVTHLKLSGGEKIPVDMVVSNLDRTTFSRLAGSLEDPDPSFSYFTLHVGVSRKVELEHHNLFIPETFEKGFEQLYAGGFPEEPIVYVNSTAGRDPNAAPSGCSNLFSVVTSPAINGKIDWRKDANLFKARTLATLKQYDVEWKEDEVLFERTQSPIYFAEAHGNHRGSLYGPSEAHRLWGMFPPTNTDPRWKNVSFCGGSVQPGAGLPMVTLSGRFAVQALAR